MIARACSSFLYLSGPSVRNRHRTEARPARWTPTGLPLTGASLLITMPPFC